MENKDIKSILITSFSWIFIYLIYLSSTSNLFKVSLSVIILYISGEYLRKRYKVEKEMVFLLWKNKDYLYLLKNLAEKYRGMFLLMADMTLFVAFGLMAFYIIKWRSLKEKILISIAGYSTLFLISFIYGPSVSMLMVILGIAKTGTASASFSLITYLVFLVGIAPLGFIALIYSSTTIAISLIKIILGTNLKISQATTLLLPGINIPFLEGIIALILLLIVHEFSHGILAIIGKIKITSMGIVSFGTIPMGAFVEADEKKLEKADNKVALRVLIAGVSSNFILAILSFFVLLIFLYLTSAFSTSSCLLIKDSMITHAKFCSYNYAIGFNGEKIDIDNNFKKIQLGSDGLIRYYPNPALALIYNTLMLSASLNLVVGIINLLPIPFFDGEQIFSRLLPRKVHLIVKYLALISLVISLIPGLL